MAQRCQFCTFFLENYYFGVDVRQVQEVLRYQEQTAVPLAPRVVRGLINLRGQIVTAIDLRLRLELGERDPELRPMNVVVRSNDGAFSLLVDRIGDVVEVADDVFEPPPDTVAGVARELIVGAYKLERGLLLILDVENTVSVEHGGATQTKAEINA